MRERRSVSLPHRKSPPKAPKEKAPIITEETHTSPTEGVPSEDKETEREIEQGVKESDCVNGVDAETNIADDPSSIKKMIMQFIGQLDSGGRELANNMDSRKLTDSVSERDCDKNDGIGTLEAGVNQCLESLGLNKLVNHVDAKTEGGSKRGDGDIIASVDLSTAIALINR